MEPAVAEWALAPPSGTARSGRSLESRPGPRVLRVRRWPAPADEAEAARPAEGLSDRRRGTGVDPSRTWDAFDPGPPRRTSQR
jgi:hypothetical protein